MGESSGDCIANVSSCCGIVLDEPLMDEGGIAEVEDTPLTLRWGDSAVSSLFGSEQCMVVVRLVVRSNNTYISIIKCEALLP